MATSFAYGSRTAGLDQAWLIGGFTTRFDNFESLTVSTPVDFSYKLNIRTDGSPVDNVEPFGEPVTAVFRNNWTFTTGQLKVVGEDGSTLLLDADNSDPQTVTITLSTDQGVESFDQPWSLWKDDLRFDDHLNIAR